VRPIRQGVVRKRLLPFIISSSGKDGALLGPQHSERGQPALGDPIYLSPQNERKTDDEASIDDKPVGKVIYLDSTGTVGLAMMQLSAVTTSSSDTRSFLFIEGTRVATSTDLSPVRGAISHIHLQLPPWFDRLDRVNGNIS